MPDVEQLTAATPEANDTGSVDSIAGLSTAEADTRGRDADDLEEESTGELEADWFAPGGATPEFEDFDPLQDDLVLVWDDSAGVEPRVQVRRCEDNPALGNVLMDDVIVAQFRTRADVDYPQVSLVPFSRARSLGWAQA